MAVHMELRVDDTTYRVTLSRDDAGNYVADAARAPAPGDPGPGPLPQIRVVDPVKERAMKALLESLARAGRAARSAANEGSRAPAA